MKQSYFMNFKKRSVLLAILFGVVTLIYGIFGGGETKVIWAAPGQNPLLQTVPTRSPDEPPPQPPDPGPPPGPPAPAPSEGGVGGNDHNEPMLPSPTVAQDNAVPLPSAPPQENNAGSPAGAQASPIVPATPDAPAPSETSVPAAAPTFSQLENQLAGPPENPDNTGTGQGASLQTGSVVTSSSSVTTSTATDGGEPLSTIELPVYGSGSLYWLYALISGVILIVGGVVLVKRV